MVRLCGLRFSATIVGGRHRVRGDAAGQICLWCRTWGPPARTRILQYRVVRLTMAESFVLIPGRTMRQGRGINEGKFGATYQSEINSLLMAPEDMERLELSGGDRVRVSSAHGQVDVAVTSSKPGELPSGLLFIAYGDLSSTLMDYDTHGSGMPTSKGIDVTLERLR